MSDTTLAVVDLFKSIPRRIRQTIYGLLGLLIILDGLLDLLPDRFGDAAVVVFGLFSSAMALANTVLPPPPPLAPLRERGLDEVPPDRGESTLVTILIVLGIIVLVAFLFGWIRP